MIRCYFEKMFSSVLLKFPGQNKINKDWYFWLILTF